MNAVALRLTSDAPASRWDEQVRLWAGESLAKAGTGPDAFDEPALGALLSSFCKQRLDASAPLPGAGATLTRWQGLAFLAGIDLSLGKLVEAHLDALAILDEIGGAAGEAVAGRTQGRLAIWAAEPPDARLRFNTEPGGDCLIEGRKSWCSGAWVVDRALVTGWDVEARPRLALVNLDQPGVRRSREGWQAVGMAATQSVDVQFYSARAIWIGAPGAYLERPGFWHGGAGIAACWYGAAAAQAEVLRAKLATRADAHALAHLGAVDAALHGAKTVLQATAAAIDHDPQQSHVERTIRTRLLVESAANLTLEHCGRALGATPYCRDPAFAKRAADLPVFLRQSHAERDQESLAKMLIGQAADPWAL